ncbi:MAG: hypothetical protein JRJ19_02855 [Deltaproteobacteria bacterium]|nr:hypothetical protein [Deltaproteobacteria bacterium]
MPDLTNLVEDEQEAEQYLVSLLKKAVICLLAIALLPWGHLAGRFIFSWDFSGGVTAVLLIAGGVTLLLGQLKNLPLVARAGIPAGLTLLAFLVGIVRSGGGMSMSANRVNIELSGALVIGIILLGFGCSYWVARPNTKIGRVVVALGTIACLIGYLWPMSVTHGPITYNMGVPLVVILKSTVKTGVMGVAMLILLVGFLASLASGLLVLPVGDSETRETRRNLARALSTFFVWMFPAMLVVADFAMLLSGVFMFFVVYMTAIMAFIMLILVRGSLVVVTQLIPDPESNSRQMPTEQIAQPAAPIPDDFMQVDGAQAPAPAVDVTAPTKPAMAAAVPAAKPISQPVVPLVPGIGAPKKSKLQQEHYIMSADAKRKVEIQRNLLERGAITQEQFEQRRKAILEKDR